MPGMCEAQGWLGRVLLVGLLTLGLEAVAKAAAEDAGQRQGAVCIAYTTRNVSMSCGLFRCNLVSDTSLTPPVHGRLRSSHPEH